MDNQQAIALLRTLCNTCKFKLFPKCAYEKPECFQAIEKAISALRVQDVPDTNIDDMISRAEAIDYVDDVPYIKDHLNIGILWKAWIEQIPSAEPEKVCIAKTNLSEEQIREAVEKAKSGIVQVLPSAQPEPPTEIQEILDYLDTTLHPIVSPDNWNVYSELYDMVSKLPSAQPEHKTGRWLIRKGISDAQCSECKMYFRDVYDMDNSDAFCRHCGAKMEGLTVVKYG